MTSKKVYLKNIISPAFWQVHKRVVNGDISELVLKGGRASTKSSYAAIELVLQLLKHNDCHAVVIRKMAVTLRNSVFGQVLWAVSILGLEKEFLVKQYPMELTYQKTGQKILFCGLDDHSKIKSIKPSFGYIGIGWFEELDQFSGEEEIRSAEQSLFRGGEYALCIKTFNPPINPQHWVNIWAKENKAGRLVSHSTYLQTPKEWLGEKFLQDASYLKQTNPQAFQHEYLGQAVGTGNRVFDNIKTEPIPPEILESFERVFHGVDWGWYPDPWAYNACSYDVARRTLYIYDELTQYRASNGYTANLLKKRGVCQDTEREEWLIADCAEPKSCSDYRSEGLPCQRVEKGKGSLGESMKWLQGLECIWIDPKRCPDTAKEFEEYSYRVDLQIGKVLEGYPDQNNHHIDAVRYATSKIWKRRGQ